MAVRGQSGLSKVIGINKPVGMSSHDVVNRVRRITGERRVGHTGTLDPLASGVLVVCVGPATRLVSYFEGNDKCYRMEVEFGSATTTDDTEGEVVAEAPVPAEVASWDFAEAKIAEIVGKQNQIPPVYSAIKVQGKKAYEEARKGNIIHLEPRPIEIFGAQLEDVSEVTKETGEQVVVWRVLAHVSKGTYMRSLARDLGHKVGTVAHMKSLVRTAVSNLTIEECVSLESLEADNSLGLVDPLRLLGARWSFIREETAALVDNGSFIAPDALVLNEPIEGDVFDAICCTSSVIASPLPPEDGETVGLVMHNRLKAIYQYEGKKKRFRASCVFPVGVERGTGL